MPISLDQQLTLLPQWARSNSLRRCSWDEFDDAQRSLDYVYDASWRIRGEEGSKLYAQAACAQVEVSDGERFGRGERQRQRQGAISSHTNGGDIAHSLRPEEARVVRGAYGLLWRTVDGRCQFLLALERSGSKSMEQFNLLGGRRTDGNEEGEEVMRREVAAKTGGFLALSPTSRCEATLWHGATKQAVYVRELPADCDDVVQVIQDLGAPPGVSRELYERAGVPPDCVVTITWVDVDRLRRIENIDPCRKGILDLLLCDDTSPTGREWKLKLERFAPRLASALAS